MSELAIAVGEVQRFVAGTRDKTAEQVQRLANATQVLADHRTDVENILHVAPTAFANAYNILNPNVPGAIGTFILTNFSNPVQFLCGAIGGIANVTASETAKLCAQYLGPALRLLNFNTLPQPPLNPYLMPSLTPDKVVYTDPALAPGGSGGAPAPPVQPPTVSAYTGLNGDVPAPPGFVPPAQPGSAPVPTLQDVLLPAEAPPGPSPRPPKGHRHRDHANGHTERAAAGLCVALTATSCGFGGVNTLPLPGAVASGSGNSVYHVQIANVGTLESNSPVMIDDVVVGSVGKLDVHNWVADVEVRVRPDVAVPANAVATIGQTSLLGSMHVALDPPLGEPPTGRLRPGSTIALNRSSTYPSTEQTLSSLSVVVNAGGLGQIGDFIHSTATALSGREGEIRELITRLDTFVGTVDDQRDRFNASIQALDRLTNTLGGAERRHHRRAAHGATGTGRPVGGAGQAGHRHAEARRVQRHRNRTRQHHPGRPGEET